MVKRLMKAGHRCVVYDVNMENVKKMEGEGAVGATSLKEFAAKLGAPKTAWMMVPAAVVDKTLEGLTAVFGKGDTIIDGGNSYYVDDIRRAKELGARGLHYVDVGTSGGVWGLERGYCEMIGGEDDVVKRLDPIFKALAPGRGNIERTKDAAMATGGGPANAAGTAGSTAEEGYLYCGPSGAGHFVKMVHNGIEYGMMAAYAEGFNILQHANAGMTKKAEDAETAPLRNPERYQYEINVAEVAEVWRRGSVIASWLLDLTAIALWRSPQLEKFSGKVSDSGEGRWTIQAAIEEGAPAPVLTAALFERFASRGEADFANKLLSAMRFEFGGHVEKKE